MMRPLHFVLLALWVEASQAQPSAPVPREGRVPKASRATRLDPAEAALLPLSPLHVAGLEGGPEGIAWPEQLRPLATLEGPALLAAHAALQRLLESFPKEYERDCAYSARAMEVSVGQEGGLYFVEIHRRLERCGWAAPGFEPSLHWFELYAVSPEGKVLARYPYTP
jgi:hypothetical protein